MVITSTVALSTREPRQGHTSISSRPCNSYSPRQVMQPIAKTYHIAAERRRPTSTSKTFGSKAFGTSFDVTLTHRRDTALRIPRLMQRSRAQRRGIIRRPQRRDRRHRQSEVGQLPTRSQRAQLPLPASRHDDLRENQWRLSPPAVYSSPPPSRQLLHTHGHP